MKIRKFNIFDSQMMVLIFTGVIGTKERLNSRVDV